MNKLRHGIFPAEILVKLPDYTKPVVLKSGGPLMNVYGRDGDEIWCEWTDIEQDDANIQRITAIHRATFHKDMLYACGRVLKTEGTEIE